MSVTIKQFESLSLGLFDKNGLFKGYINSEIQLNDVRVQIKEQELEGYHLHFKDQIINIDKDGNFDCLPKGFFDANLELLLKLV